MNWKEQLIQELGELCHESYLGHNSTAPNEYEYCYKNEVINLLDTDEGKAIISKYFEKLIAEIELPDLDPKLYSSLTGNQKRAYGQAKENLQKVKQRLRDKWL